MAPSQDFLRKPPHTKRSPKPHCHNEPTHRMSSNRCGCVFWGTPRIWWFSFWCPLKSTNKRVPTQKTDPCVFCEVAIFLFVRAPAKPPISATTRRHRVCLCVPPTSRFKSESKGRKTGPILDTEVHHKIESHHNHQGFPTK